MCPDLSSWMGWEGGNRNCPGGMSWSCLRDMRQEQNQATGRGRRVVCKLELAMRGRQGLRHQRKLGAGYKPRKPDKTEALEHSALRYHWKCGLQAGRCQSSEGRQDPNKERDLFQVSPQVCSQAGPRTLMVSHSVLSRTEGHSRGREDVYSNPDTDGFQASSRQALTYVLAERSLQCLLSRHPLRES